MDTAETAMLVGLGALAVGAAIGWHLRLEQRRTRAAGAAPTVASALAPAEKKAPVMKPKDQHAANYFNLPIASSGASLSTPPSSSSSGPGGCGCQ